MKNKKGVPNQDKWQFSVHMESKLNWFRYKVKFVFVKWMEAVKWDEQEKNAFVHEVLLSTQENWSLIDLHQLQRV